MSAAADVRAVSNSEAFENEGFIRFSIYRSVPHPISSDRGETVLVYTEDGFAGDNAAVAGRDFVFTRETIWFEPGQMVAVIQVPLLDNGLLDGDRYFRLRTEPRLHFLFNECPPETGEAVIRDNEQAPARLDPTFHPEFPPVDSGEEPFIFALADGRMLISGGSRGIAVLKPNGAVDPRFYPDLRWEGFQPLQVLPSGQVFAYARKCLGNCDPVLTDLVLLSDSGMADRSIRLPLPGDSSTQFVVGQPDGALLLLSWRVGNTSTGILRRVRWDGSPDPSFLEVLLEEDYYGIPAHRNAHVQADGKILMARTVVLNDGKRGPLVRLEANGVLDPAFSPSFNEIRDSPLLLRNVLLTSAGKIVVNGWFASVDGFPRPGIARLHANGRLDLSFDPPGMDHSAPVGSIIEQPSGKLVLSPTPPAGMFPFPATFLTRLNEDGSIDPGFRVNVHLTHQCVGTGAHALAVTDAGDVLFTSNFDTIDGLPCAGFARLLDSQPHPMLVVTSLALDPAESVARIPVIRHGAVTNEVTISFRTVDGTAKADEDYIASAGKLSLPAMVKEGFVEVTLQPMRRTQSCVFGLELVHPDHPTQPAAIAIALLPELRITGLRPRSQRVRILLEGTARGEDYSLESSFDLKTWMSGSVVHATRSTMLIEADPAPPGAMRFYRAHKR